MGDRRPVLDLTELISALGDPDVELDVESATARIARALHADVVAICGRDSVESAHGLDRERRPGELLMRLKEERRGKVDVPGLGECHMSRTSLENGSILLLLRTSSPFGDDELRFAKAVGRVLGLALRMRSSLDAERAAHQDMQRRVDDNRRLVSQLRERQDLLDRLFRIQRSISHRAPTKDVLDSITAGASELLAVERVDLRLNDQDSPEDLVLVSAIGAASRDDEGIDVVNVTDPVAGRSVR